VKDIDVIYGAGEYQAKYSIGTKRSVDGSETSGAKFVGTCGDFTAFCILLFVS
jgi:hypothetical protein